MKNIFKFLVFLLITSAVLFSCNPKYDATIEELDLAITKYQEDQDFSALQSFYLYDTIVYITDEDDENPPEINEGQSEHIISEVRRNLLDIGWTENTDTVGGVQADVSILISALATDVYYYYYGWWYWWYWYPWYPGYYPPYPGYPVWGYPVYAYTVGTVIVDMVNMGEVVVPFNDGSNEPFKVPIVWTGAVNGILAGSDQDIQSRLTEEIDQVFDQSLYLHK